MLKKLRFPSSNVFVIAKPENKMMILCLLSAETICLVAFVVLFNRESVDICVYLLVAGGGVADKRMGTFGMKEGNKKCSKVAGTKKRHPYNYYLFIKIIPAGN